MQKLLNTLKVLTVLICVIAAYFGYTFWSIWQQNNQAELSALTLSKEELALGETFELSASFKVPWHREMNIEQFVALPEGLRLMPGTLKVERQKLQLDGYRVWKSKLTAIALNDGAYEGRNIEFRLHSDRNKKQNSLTYPLPKITVKVPNTTSTSLISRNNEMDDSVLSQPEAAASFVETAESSNKFFWYLLIIICISIVVYFFFRPAKILPPWEEAFKKLSNLACHPPENFEKFFLSLTDILKGYSERRFSFNATACSSQEFVNKLSVEKELPKEQIEELESMLKTADAVKFSGNKTSQLAVDVSIEKVHRFISATKPTEEAKK